MRAAARAGSIDGVRAAVGGAGAHARDPALDRPFSAKNEPMDPEHVRHALVYVGLLAGEVDGPPVRFTRRDGSPGRISRHVDVLQTGPPPPSAPLVVQVSRWDAMKDMPGVMEGFARHVDPRSARACCSPARP
jgi:trehalose synthase